MTYPVTVVIPTIDSRFEFLMSRCLPSVKSASPAQIIVVFGEGNGNEKRNIGAKAATQKYLLCVDDDCEIDSNCIEKMVEALELDPTSAFAYSGYRVSVECKSDHNWPPPGDIMPGRWNLERLRSLNYIDTTSLIRKSSFYGFDPEIKRFQDWDMWLTMAEHGEKGVFVPRSLFRKCVIDDGVTIKIPEDQAREAIMRKHSSL